MHCLTNINPNDTYGKAPTDHDTLSFMVHVAALRSGQNVKYLTCAMPDHWTHMEPNCNHYGCIVGFEKERNYSAFWREYEKLEECLP